MVGKGFLALVVILIGFQVPSKASFFSNIFGNFYDTIAGYQYIDKYKRTLDDHEGPLKGKGHTLADHVNISMDRLRERCREDFGYWGSINREYRSRYVSKGSASSTIKHILDDNKAWVLGIEAQHRRTGKEAIYSTDGDLKFVHAYNSWYSNAIDCRQGVLGTTTKLGRWTWHKDEVRLDNQARLVLKVNKHETRWFVLTSYPVK